MHAEENTISKAQKDARLDIIRQLSSNTIEKLEWCKKQKPMKGKEGVYVGQCETCDLVLADYVRCVW